MKKYTLIILFSIISFVTIAQKIISNQEAFENLHKDSTIQLIDVRTLNEYENKHIKNAINIDWRDQNIFTKQLNNLDKNRPVYIYCLSGGRSNQAASKLKAMGYDVYDIQGGIAKWEVDNLPIIYSNKPNEEVEITIENYHRLINSYPVVLVDFFAPWCSPCQELTRTIDDITVKYQNKIKVIKINIDIHSKLYKSLKIDGIPYLIIYKNGKEVWSHKGITDSKTIEINL